MTPEELEALVFTADCPDESDHLWEHCHGFDLCVWCHARVKCRHG